MTSIARLRSLTNLAPYHLLLYSTLLGTEIYQTFIMTKLSYKALPKSGFRTLQKQVFPVYFTLQTSLLFLTALTFPPHGVFSLRSTPTDLVLFSLAGVTSTLNLFIYGPKTTDAMIAKVHEGEFVEINMFNIYEC